MTGFRLLRQSEAGNPTLVAVLDGEPAVPCNPESAIPGSKSSSEALDLLQHGTASSDDGWVPCNGRV